MVHNAVTDWESALQQLDSIKDVCEAFIRGDQPEKTEHLTLVQTIEVHDEVKTVLDFCVTALGGPDELTPTQAEAYTYARQYVRTMNAVLLRHDDVDPGSDFGQTLKRWQTDELWRLPQITYKYV